MARSKKKQPIIHHKSLIEMADLGDEDLRILLAHQASQIQELEKDPELSENGELLLPMLRGLVKYLTEEFLGEDMSDVSDHLKDFGEEEDEEDEGDYSTEELEF